MKNISRLRKLTALVPVALVCVGLAFNAGTGTLSAFGIGDIAAICPLGVLETFLADRTLLPRGVAALALFALVALLFGRAFCSWVCPVSLISSLRRRSALTRRGERRSGGALEASPDTSPGDNAAEKQRSRTSKVDSRHGVLLAALASSAVFGFPVFCLICPVGLTFATIISLWRLFQFAEPTWEIVVFPLIIAVEVVLFRRWCHSICPLSALMSLIARFGKTFQPHVRAESCLHEKGGACLACNQACPEGIDLHGAEKRASDFAECTRCGACAESCPMQAISFPFIPRHDTNSQDE